MAGAEDRIEVEPGIEVMPSGEPGHFIYLPRVTPETNASGQPAVLLLKTAAGGTLQLGAEIEADDSILAKVRAGLQAKLKVDDVQLDRGAITVRAARLLLSSSSGEQELQRATTSELPGGRAIFRASLTAEQTKLVEEALNGTAKRLRIVYDLDLNTTARASVQIEGDATEVTRALAEDATESDALRSLEHAIDSGELKLVREQFGQKADSLLATAMAGAKTKAAKMLLSMTPARADFTGEGSDTILSNVKLQEPRTISTSQSADIADWFRAGRKATVLGTSIAGGGTPRSGLLKIALGFEARDVPIAFIELNTGGNPVALRGPGWAPVFLNAADTVTAKVNYTGGARPFVTTLQTPGAERLLQLEELGLFKVSLDASARKAAGAKKLSATVEYLRDGETLETWPIHFQFGDWTEEWFLVTGASTLNGILCAAWEETDADGKVLRGGPIESEEPLLRLTEPAPASVES